jgi:hypothetical protein
MPILHLRHRRDLIGDASHERTALPLIAAFRAEQSAPSPPLAVVAPQGQQIDLLRC